MADGKVIVTLSVQDAQALAAWQRGKEGIGAMSAELKGTGTSAKAAGDSIGSMVKKQVAEFTSMAGAVGLVSNELRRMIALRNSIRSEEAATTRELDATFRAYQVQAQIPDEQTAAASRAKITAIARQEAFPITETSEIARQLVSSGFSAEEVLNRGGAQEVVAGMKASAVKGEQVDVRQMVESITQFILAQSADEDKALTRKNLERAVRGTQSLFLKRNIQFEDLGDLAKAAPALSEAKIPMEDQLAMFTALRDVLPSEESATMLRNVVQRMQTAGKSKSKKKLLGRIGLTPEDIDLEGETPEEAFGRLGKALQKVGPAEKAKILVGLFEERGRMGASYFINNASKISEYRKEAIDREAFALSHRVATEGYAAEMTRAEIDKQRARFGGQGAKDELIATRLEAENPVDAELARRARAVGLPSELLGSARQESAEIDATGVMPGKIENTTRQAEFRGMRRVDVLRRASSEETEKLLPQFQQATEIARDVGGLDRGYKLSDPRMMSRQRHPELQANATATAATFGDFIETKLLRGEETKESLTPARLEKLLLAELIKAHGQNDRRVKAAEDRIAAARKERGENAQMEELLRQTNALLGEVARNTADKRVKVTNAGDADNAARRASSRPPAIGGN